MAKKFKELVEDAKVKTKELGQKAVEKGKAVIAYVEEHPQAMAAVSGITFMACRLARRGIIDHNQQVYQRRKLYDPRTGKTTVPKRDLTLEEKVELERRYKAGETYQYACYDMGIKTK